MRPPHQDDSVLAVLDWPTIGDTEFNTPGYIAPPYWKRGPVD